MTFYEPLTPYELEQRITECISDLETATDEYRELAKAAGRAEVRHKTMRAMAIRASTEKNLGDREADADRSTAIEFEARRDAESLSSVQKEVLVSLRAILSAYQSLLATVRSQI